MSDTPENPAQQDDGPPRDTETGRYLRKHSADQKDDGETTGVPPAAGDGDGKDGEERKDGKKRWLLLLLLLLILLLLVCAGFVYNKWWSGDKDPDPAATSTPTANATATADPSPTTSPTPSPTPTVKTISMPDVVGMPADDAKVILEGAGFTNIKFVTDDDPGKELQVLVSFKVTKQSPAAGANVPADSELVITCKTASNGKG